MAQARRCDLHTHSRHSDGTHTPAELVRLAREHGISCLALTDHDTIRGVAEAQREGAACDVEVIPGVEISVIFEPGTMHILGYFVDCGSSELERGLASVQNDRRNRNPMMIEKLRAAGVEITMDEVERESGGDQVGRPHFASVLVKKGYVKNAREAFNRYLAKGAPAYVDKRKLTSAQAIQMIHGAGGVAALAHPKQLRLDRRPKELDQTLEQLKSEGLAGIEVYSSCQSKAESDRYLKLARRFGLIVTGGSDFHGSNRLNVPIGWMGNGARIPYETVDQMKKVILDRKTK